jgi:hypothetical protein
MKRIAAVLTLVSFNLIFFAAPAPAQQEQPEANPGVARISLMNGDVSTQRGDSGDWVAATVNAPVVSGDRVATAANSRTEIQLDYADIIRLSEKSEVQLAELANNQIQVQVALGLVSYVVLKGGQASSEIDTPGVAVRPMGEGVYRIQVDPGGDTLVTVRRGEAEVSNPQGSTRVRDGETLTVRGTADNVQYRIDSAQARDEWDSFNDQRDAAILNAQSYRYTNQYYTGISDLDKHGRWTSVPGYDWCWTPEVDSGWVPYSNGRWSWEPYYGWTWVSYEPWGWAPYHYGRWFCHNSVWSWWPGPVWGVGLGYRPLWSPAYVSFFGFGFGHHNFGFGLGFGFGSIGWLPIGPCDPFIPWYGRAGWGHGGYYNRYNAVHINNITNIHNVTNIRNVTGVPNAMAPLSSRANGFSNLQGLQNGDPHVARAVNMVAADRFGQGNLRGAIQHPGVSSLREGRVVAGGLPVVPTKASLSPSNRPVNYTAVPRNSARQQVFAGQQPAARPQSFTQSAAQVRQMVQNHNPETGVMSESRSAAGVSGASRNGNTALQGNSPRSVGTFSQSGASNVNSARRLDTAPAQSGRNAVTEQRPTSLSPQSSQRSGSTPGSGGQQQVLRSDRPGFAQQPPSRNSSAAVQSGAENRGWHQFSAPAQSSASQERQMAPRNSGPGSYRPPSSQESSQPSSRPQSSQFQSRPGTQTWGGNRSSSAGSSGWGRFSGAPTRSPLDLSNPIVTQRNPSYGGGYSRGYSVPPRYSASPRYSAPPSSNYGGGYAPPPRSSYGSGSGAAPHNFSGPSNAPRSSSGSSGGSHGGGGGNTSGGSHGGSGHSSGGSHSRR